jgi:hypothetical protein
MASYEVKIPANLGGLTLKNGHDIMFVEAQSAADALALAGGHFDGDSQGAWAAATATEITTASDLSPVVDAQGKTTNYVLKVRVDGGNGDAGPAAFEHVCTAGQSYAQAWAAMVVLINAHADFANAAHAADLLTIANAGDNYGDHTVTCTFEYGGVPIPSFVGAITHEGSAGAVLSVATSTGVVTPKVLGSARLR